MESKTRIKDISLHIHGISHRHGKGVGAVVVLEKVDVEAVLADPECRGVQRTLGSGPHPERVANLHREGKGFEWVVKKAVFLIHPNTESPGFSTGMVVALLLGSLVVGLAASEHAG